MVMRLEPLARCLRSIPEPGLFTIMSPAGRQFDQDTAARFAEEKAITLICGRYEGIDARLQQLFPLEEISLCPAVFNGGEVAALGIIEATSRLAPGFLGRLESAAEESFTHGLLEYPHYTRPEQFESLAVPTILTNGDHARIAAWRRQQALSRTLSNRPEMLSSAALCREDVLHLQALQRLRPGRNISFCLCHDPVRLGDGRVGASSLTNLDIHDISRISLSYKMGDFFVLTPLEGQHELLRSILEHWLKPAISDNHADRRDALQKVVGVRDYQELEAEVVRRYGAVPTYVLTSAAVPKQMEKCVSPARIRELARTRPIVILLGTARGLVPEALPIECERLRPLRFLDANHLPVRAAAAIIADRVLGDVY